MNKLKCILSITVLLSLLVGCSESSHYYISMTTTHATDQEFIFTSNTYMYDLTSKKLNGSLTVVFDFSLTKSLKTLIISMLLSFFIVKFVKINVLTWANVCYNRHRR